MDNPILTCTCHSISQQSHTCVLHQTSELLAIDTNIKRLYSEIRKLEERRMELQRPIAKIHSPKFLSRTMGCHLCSKSISENEESARVLVGGQEMPVHLDCYANLQRFEKIMSHP